MEVFNLAKSREHFTFRFFGLLHFFYVAAQIAIFWQRRAFHYHVPKSTDDGFQCSQEVKSRCRSKIECDTLTSLPKIKLDRRNFLYQLFRKDNFSVLNQRLDVIASTRSKKLRIGCHQFCLQNNLKIVQSVCQRDDL